jgi:hypothetical protein
MNIKGYKQLHIGISKIHLDKAWTYDQFLSKKITPSYIAEINGLDETYTFSRKFLSYRLGGRYHGGKSTLKEWALEREVIYEYRNFLSQVIFPKYYQGYFFISKNDLICPLNEKEVKELIEVETCLVEETTDSKYNSIRYTVHDVPF